MKNDRFFGIIELCMGSSCYCRGNRTLAADLKDLIAKRNWENLVTIKGCLCKDTCANGPNISINGIPCKVTTIGGLEKQIEQNLIPVEPIPQSTGPTLPVNEINSVTMQGQS